jgi:hypothetical protein
LETSGEGSFFRDLLGFFYGYSFVCWVYFDFDFFVWLEWECGVFGEFCWYVDEEFVVLFFGCAGWSVDYFAFAFQHFADTIW